MANILIAYSTTDGHTRHICERIKEILEREGHKIALVAITDEVEFDPERFDKIVIGASIRYGRHRPAVYDFIKRNQKQLESVPNAFFSVNVVARKPEKNQPASNPYLQKFLRKISWQPQNLAVFAGKINYPIYTIWDRQIIRFIMWMTGGPTDPEAIVEFTDWKQVENFGRLIAEI